jgi:hypothetical protein
MSHVLRTVPRGARVIDGVTLQITELIWTDEGRSFAVHRLDSGDDLTVDGWFDLFPTDVQLADLLDDARDLWRCVCGHRFATTDHALIDDHLRDCPAAAR